MTTLAEMRIKFNPQALAGKNFDSDLKKSLAKRVQAGDTVMVYPSKDTWAKGHAHKIVRIGDKMSHTLDPETGEEVANPPDLVHDSKGALGK